MRSTRTHTHTQHSRFARGPYLLIGEDLEHHERHGKPPEQHVEGAPRRPPEAQMVVLLVFGPLFNGPVPNEGTKGEEGKKKGSALLGEGAVFAAVPCRVGHRRVLTG